jgi:DNA-directed RNA polymerase I, II, and III subunit RPABC5
MLPVVLCVSCGAVLADKWRTYERLQREGRTKGEALDILNIRRYCCRNNMLSHVDLIETLLRQQAPLSAARAQ